VSCSCKPHCVSCAALSLFCTYTIAKRVIGAVRRILRCLQTERNLPKHLVARENSKRLVNTEYMRLSEPQDNRVRTVGGPDFIVLNEPVIYEGLNDLLYRLGNCEASCFGGSSVQLSHGTSVPMPFIFGPNFSSSLSLNGKQ
jgi:hypothetical protein